MLCAEREDIAGRIISKIGNNEKLTDEEFKYMREVLLDPLQEFCNREGTFRLVEILHVSPEIANELEDEASNIIRDTIDYEESLYDSFDAQLRFLIAKEK